MTRDVVLLNGWGMTAAVWQALLDVLPADRAWHRIDLHALTGDEVGDLARAAAARAPRECDIVGWSLGAQIALQWAHERPAQVRRLVLLAATPCFVVRPGWPVAMDARTFADFESALRSAATQALRRFASLQANGDAHMTTVARELRAALCNDEDATHALQAGLACLRNTDLRAMASAIRQPVCLIHGREDRLAPLAAAEFLQRALPASRLHALTATAHAPHVSNAPAVARWITEFLNER